VKQKFYVLLVLSIAFGQLFAQDFTGTVKKNDSLSAPIYQANIDILEGGKPFKSLKTYFNGTYKFTPAKNQTYKIHITYSGYTDTTFEVSTDKNGVLSANNVLVKLTKDGMRLMGVIKSAEEDFPIEGAVVVLKNIMNRLESRQTTGIDGSYNFKLEYETNYKFSIDKRSPGIINKFKDTTFYFSTVGFNIPLDYKLNVSLDPVLYAQTDVREGYDPTKAKNAKSNAVAAATPTKEKELVPFAETKQPFIASEKSKTADDKVAQLQAELEKALKEIESLRKRELEAKKGPDLSVSSTAPKKKKEDKNLEVVVIKDEVVKPNIQSSVSLEKDRQAAEAKAKEIEAKIVAQQKADEGAEARAQELAKLQKQQEDSLRTAREAEQNKKMLAALNEKANQAKEDSLTKIKVMLEAKKAAEAKLRADSLAKVLAIQNAERVADSLSQIKLQAQRLEKAKADSISKVKAQLALREKAKADSIANAKQFLAAREKAIADSIAIEKQKIAALEKAKSDSIAKAKAQLALLEKARADSVAKVSAALALARQKAETDSLAAAKLQMAALEKAKKDSVNNARIIAAQQKAIADSTAKANAAIAAMKKKQEETTAQLRREIERQDSILHADILRKQAERAEQDKRNRELAEKAKREAMIAEQLNAKRIEDSIAQAKLIAKQQAENEAKLKAQQAEEKRLAEEKQKAEQARLAAALADSMAQAKKNEELAAKAAAELKKQLAIQEQIRKKQVEDSLSLAREEEKRNAKANEARLKAETAAREQATRDSIAQAKQTAERLAKEYATAQAQAAALAKQQREQQQKDSLANAKLEAEKLKQELAERKKVEELAQAVQKKRTEDSMLVIRDLSASKQWQDSIQKEKEELRKLAELIAHTKKNLEKDSIERAQRLKVKAEEEQQRAARQDSINRAKQQLEAALKAQDEFRKKELEKASLAQKIFADSLAAINSEQEKLKAELLALQKKEKEAQNPPVATATKKSEPTTTKKTTPTVEPEKPVVLPKEPSIVNNKININLPAISFDKNSVDIGAKQKLEFKALLQLMKDNPTKTVVLYAIASADETNPKQLSLRRSDSMLRYLIQNGVAIEKVKSMYFGNEKSRNGCVSSMCPEELQQQNRCVAYELIESSSD